MILKRYLLFSLAILFLLTFYVTYFTSDKGFHQALEYVFYDSWHQLTDLHYPARHTVLITIDDETLLAYPDEPLIFWTPQIAKAIQVLRKAGARIIGLDFLFSISPEKWLKKNLSWNERMASVYGTPIRREIATGKVVMVASAMPGETKDQLLMPSIEYILSIPNFDIPNHVGLADLQPSADGAVRNFIMQPDLNIDAKLKADAPRYTFAELLAKRAFPDNYALTTKNTIQPINFTGPPGTIPRIKLKTLLAENALADPTIQALKDKIVIIGGEYQGMSDTHISPYNSNYFSNSSFYMTGLEIQANIVESILSDNQLTHLNKYLVGLYQAVILFISLLIFSSLSRIKSIIYLFSIVLLVAFTSFIAFNRFLIIPSASLITGVFILFAGAMFLKYTFVEKERLRVTSAFGRYVSPAIVNQIVTSGKTPELGGVNQELSVLFSDIRNFTTISERLKPEELVEMLNTYFEKICNIVLEEGGTIDKFIGDAIMVQFGAPIPYHDHADRAIRVALKIRQEAREFKNWMEKRFHNNDIPDFAVGVGIHSGSAIVGNIGSSTNMGYTVIGDVINSAARIESQTKNFQCDIVISRETLESARSNIKTGLNETVFVKGKHLPLELFEVIDIIPSESI